MDAIIKDATIITMDKERRVLKNFSIGIEDGRIREIAPRVEGEAESVIDGKGKLVIPGLINTHTHLSMTLLRGVADDLPLTQWLNEEIWPIEAKLEDKHVYAGALLGCLEMIKSGTTLFNDMYFSVDKIAKAVKESGIRGALSLAIIDLGDAERADRLLKESEKIVRTYKGEERIMPFYGPHAPYTCSEETLVKVKEKAERDGVGIHIHVAETEDEVKNLKEAKGMRPFEYLDKIGFLGKNVVAAHSVWASGKEMEVLKKRGVKVSHNPVSNMKTAAGTAPVAEYVKRGISVSLGTDGAASNNNLDILEDMKICALLHKVVGKDASLVPAEKVLEFATIEGAKALGLEDELGSIEVGKRADLAILDLAKPSLTPLFNPVSHVVYAANGADVDTVIVDGKIVMQNRKVVTLDEGKVLELGREAARDLMERAGRGGEVF